MSNLFVTVSKWDLVASEHVEIASTCHACQADLTHRSALEEYRICYTNAYSHLETRQGRADNDYTDTVDEVDVGALPIATTAFSCARCGTLLAGNKDEE